MASTHRPTSRISLSRGPALILGTVLLVTGKRDPIRVRPSGDSDTTVES